jgi:hypothetical protein
VAICFLFFVYQVGRVHPVLLLLFVTMNYVTQSSEIHGQGNFATQAIAAGDAIGLLVDKGIGTPLIRYTNHSFTPNAKAERTAYMDISAIALRDIAAGEEITIDYRDYPNFLRFHEEGIRELYFWQYPPVNTPVEAVNEPVEPVNEHVEPVNEPAPEPETGEPLAYADLPTENETEYYRFSTALPGALRVSAWRQIFNLG